MCMQKRTQRPFIARSITQTVLGITAARFKIGHTPRKLPDKPSATFRFIAYLQSRKYYYTLSFPDFQVFSEFLPAFSQRIFTNFCGCFCIILLHYIGTSCLTYTIIYSGSLRFTKTYIRDIIGLGIVRNRQKSKARRQRWFNLSLARG